MSEISSLSLSLVPTDGGADRGTIDMPVGQDDTAANFHWPVPKIGQFAAEVEPDGGLPCEVEGLNGRIMRVALQSLDPYAARIDVMSTGLRAPMQLRFAQFRRVTIVPLLSARTALPADGVHSYRLTSRNGTISEGRTVGYVRLDTGVFLFEPAGDSGTVRRSFIPTTAFESLQIGDAELAGQAPPPRPAFNLSALGPLTEPGALLELASDSGAGSLKEPRPSPVEPAPLDFATFKLDFEGGKAAATSARPPSAPAAPTAPAAPAATKIDVATELLSSKPVTTVPDLIAALDRQASMPLVRMGEALIGLGLIDEKKLEQALVIQRGDRSSPLGEILVRQGHIQRQDLQFALIRKMGYPLVDLEQFQPEFEALSKVPYALASRLQVLPLHLRAGQLVVAMEDPTRGKALDELEFATALKMSATLVKPGQIMGALDSAYRRISADVGASRSGPDGASDPMDSAELLASLEMEGADGRTGEEERGIEQSDNSLVRLINQMILEAQSQGASDIHIETLPGKERLRIRFRRDGMLKPYLELPHTYRTALIARIKIMCDLDISEKRKPQDGKINFGKFHPGSRLELRVATIPTSNGLEDAVLRLLASAKTLPLDDVGLAPRPLSLLKSIVERPYGMFLCVGPTGSGKTTTLHSALGYINRPDRKIWTAEDPVEITQPGLRQVQVNPKIDWTFAKALRAFLRADPDVIMVGEIRDKETATVAVESSLTGHLVMSTLHTNSAPETVTRLLDMGMDPFNFADALLGVLAQRLVRRTCSHCRTSRLASSDEVDELLADYLSAYGNAEGAPTADAVLSEWRQRFGVEGQLMHFHGTGCDKCGGTGLRGRVGIHELMTVSREIRRLIQTGARVDELQRQALLEGMLTLRMDGIEKVLQGLTTLGEVRASSN